MPNEKYNTESVQAYRVYSMHDVYNGKPGAFYWVFNEQNVPSEFIHNLPGGIVGTCSIRGGGSEIVNSTWDWNGDLDKPTLRPSIHAVPRPNCSNSIGWHGWLTDGFFKSC